MTQCPVLIWNALTRNFAIINPCLMYFYGCNIDWIKIIWTQTKYGKPKRRLIVTLLIRIKLIYILTVQMTMCRCSWNNVSTHARDACSGSYKRCRFKFCTSSPSTKMSPLIKNSKNLKLVRVNVILSCANKRYISLERVYSSPLGHMVWTESLIVTFVFGSQRPPANRERKKSTFTKNFKSMHVWVCGKMFWKYWDFV